MGSSMGTGMSVWEQCLLGVLPLLLLVTVLTISLMALMALMATMHLAWPMENMASSSMENMASSSMENMASSSMESMGSMVVCSRSGSEDCIYAKPWLYLCRAFCFIINHTWDNVINRSIKVWYLVSSFVYCFLLIQYFWH